MKKYRKIICLLLVLTLLFALTACGGKKADDGATSGKFKKNADGTYESITIGASSYLGRFLAGLSPQESFPACDAVFNTIFLRDAQTKEVYSDILESWTWEDDTHLVCKLKDGVMFSNGDKATASDLIFSYYSHDERGSNYLNQMGLVFDECEARDELTAVFAFQEPTSVFFDTPIYLIDEKWSREVGWDSEEWYKPVGSGPYTCTEYVADDHITLKAKDDYWNKDHGKAVVKEWIIKYYPDANTMFMDLEVGNIAFCNVEPVDYTRFLKEGGKGFNVVKKTTGSAMVFEYGYLDRPDLWGEKDLREAIAYAVDWDELAKVALGDAYIPGYSLVSSTSPEYIDPGRHEFNTEKAKELLAKHGYNESNPLTLHVYQMDTSTYKKLSESFLYYCGLAGIKVNVEYGDVSSAIAAWVELGGEDFGFYWNVFGSITGDIHGTIDTANDPNGCTWQYIDDDHFQELFNKMLHTSDDAEKAALSKEIQQYVYDETLIIPFAEMSYSCGYLTDIFTEEQINEYCLNKDYTLIGTLGLEDAWK